MTKLIEQDSGNGNAYAEYLPPHLRERYAESLGDAQLTNLRRQIALMEVRIKSSLENLDRQPLDAEKIAAELKAEFDHLAQDDIHKLAEFIMGYLPETFIDHRTFRRFEQLIDRYEFANLDGRLRDADRAKRQLFVSIREGRREGDVWDQVKETMEELRKLTAEEEKRINQNQQSLTLDKVVMLMGIAIGVFKESVRKYVPDQQIQQYILEDADRHYQRQLGAGHTSKAD